MRLKTFLLAAAVATLPILGACDQPTAPATPDVVVEQQKSAPTSAIDPSTGEMAALNYRQMGAVVTIPTGGARSSALFPQNPCNIDTECVEEPCYDAVNCYPEPCYDGVNCYPEPCDPIYSYGCEPCPRDNPAAWCYTPPCTPAIAGFNTQRAGIQPYGGLEVSGTTSSGCGYLVLTGIGARVSGSDKYTTLHLRGRRINPDGSWGETVTYRFGSSPNHSLEAWGEVPYSSTDFYGITGVGIGQNSTEDVRTLVIYYRKIELTSAGVRATGPTYQLRYGGNPYGYVDATYVTYADNEVFVGAGFRAIDSGERTATMAAHIGLFP